MTKYKTLHDLLTQMQVIELSHTLEEHIPIWPTHSRYQHTLWHSYWHGDEAVNYQILINEHNGTHVDAPAHFIREGPAHVWINQMPIRTFFGPCTVLDLSFIGSLGVVEGGHIQEWEQEHGAIDAGDVVLIHLGWSKYWKKRPDDKQFVQDWPGIGKSAAEYLTEKKIKMIGVDTLAIDVFGSTDNPAHHTFLGSQIPIMENLNNLDKMPTRAYFIALPLPIAEGSGSPIRAVAFC
ncbi:cyclase family protein [Paenibacillus xerothermodurans]|uniref:Cyclase family protein n=1 Tax=Paenibacillus xerothermodurans TaxID=1977292 RepID=A0A2W1NMB0_PAEXE|nr:cyclase family protein [Paenibacillus xerothermodurans]PZE20595.1 cyclase family protein [Paenibacillus xerothermodurans]